MEERVVLRERKGFSWFDCLQQKQYNRSNITKCLSSDTQPASKLSHRPCCMGNEKFPTNNFSPLSYTTFRLHPGEFCSGFLASQALKDNEQNYRNIQAWKTSLFKSWTSMSDAGAERSPRPPAASVPHAHGQSRLERGGHQSQAANYRS